MTASLHPICCLPATIEEVNRFRKWACAGLLKPFCRRDTSAGMEYELQTAISGNNHTVDLPLTIKQSSYFKNLIKRSERGDCPKTLVGDLCAFLEDRSQTIWENSWIRMKTDWLSDHAARVVEHDFRADKSRPNGPLRSDRHRFFTVHRGEQWLRLPISYVLKLALADCLGREQLPGPVATFGESLLDHFISDNTSPEILSLHVVRAGDSTIGDAAAKETARTFLFAQLLLFYANRQFHLRRNGQHALLYFSPQVPQRQRRLNDLIPDSFYRHLFMSPCLSGWTRGEEKHAYMELCHRTLSRSQLNTLAKLREAGILANNLVTLPAISNTCLSNNGIHVSLGSHLLSACAADNVNGFSPSVEKYLGDLVIKIFEHFLPLLVTTCSAAPYRLAFPDFHPEKVLGFLPHELDYTHLRMLWRRWRKKAAISLFGTSITPFGPPLLDRVIASLFRAKGDFVPDFRLIDYLVSLLSTETSPSLNGILGNHVALLRDLNEMGVFDERMAIYLPYRLRDYFHKGFSGFEGRFYSLFPTLGSDMELGVNLQNLITAFAYQHALLGTIDHRDIPDTPHCESERRQIFFATAIGVPTVFIETGTNNRFLARIMTTIRDKRASRRYRGYTRIKIESYQLALLDILKEDCPELIEELGMTNHLQRMRSMLLTHVPTAARQLTDSIMDSIGSSTRPLAIPAKEFNLASEVYYRTRLRLDHIDEGISVIAGDCRELTDDDRDLTSFLLQRLAGDGSLEAYVNRHRNGILEESLDGEVLRQMITLCLTLFYHQSVVAAR